MTWSLEVAQLKRELHEALEQQTATSEVLQVISSSPGELERVFTAMLANATRICEAQFSNFMLHEGSTFRAVAWHGEPTYVEKLQHEPLITISDDTRAALQAMCSPCLPLCWRKPLASVTPPSAISFEDTLRRALAAPKPSEAKRAPNAGRPAEARQSHRKTYLLSRPAHNRNVVGAGFSDNNPDPLAVATGRSPGRFPVFIPCAI